jgi:hypothetical protein
LLPPIVIDGPDPAAYTRHLLHNQTRDWAETNCYVDLLIEVLAQRGEDPRAALGFTVAQDFEGDQFTFFKFPAADIATLYGVEILELAIYDRLEDHLRTQIGRGRLPLVEVDSFYLPDTRGVSYRATHGKTTIGVNRLDSDNRRLDYFHNSGYFRLEAEDFDALLRPSEAGGLPLFPYVEFLKFGKARPAFEQVEIARGLLERHLARRPPQNPFRAWGETLERNVARLASEPVEWFHRYAFNTLRQAGANFELLASHMAWLQQHGDGGLERSKLAAQSISQNAKLMQFQLARAAVRKKSPSFAEAIDQMAADYDTVLDSLQNRFAVTGAAA